MRLGFKSSFFEGIWRWARWAVLLIVAGWLIAWLAAETLIVSPDLQHADAMVVLAGSSTYQERTHRAAQLFHEGRAPKIILTNDDLKSGWSLEQERNPLFVERAIDELTRRGVPAERIEVMPGHVSSTYDEAMQMRRYSSEHGLHSILVVTSAYQSRRARWTFGRVFRGSDISIGLDPVLPGENAPRQRTWWWHRLGWELVPGEYLKMIYYSIHYR
jgi:uncharacterized SAM-binding protein YcdF (DUF218 family)